MKSGIIMLVVSALLIGCGAQDAIDATKEVPTKMGETNGKLDITIQKMDETNAKMGKMLDSVRLQKMEIALKILTAKENTRYLSPIPTGMVPWADLFAKEAKSIEIIELAYLWLVEIDKALPADLDLLPSGDYAVEDKKQINLDKLIRV